MPRPVAVPFRAPASPAQSSGSSPRTRGAQPAAVLRLALRPGGRFGRGAEPSSEFPRGASMDRVQWLEAMVETSDDGLLVLGLDGRVLGANRAAERLADLRGQAVIGQRASPPHDDSDFPWSIVGEAAGL